jgi:hypothetical protein
MKRRQWKVFYLGDYRVIHHKGASVTQAPHLMNWHFHRSMVLFHRKHLVDRYPFFVNWLVYAGISLRYAARGLWMLLSGRRPERSLPVPGTSRLAAPASASMTKVNPGVNSPGGAENRSFEAEA